MKRITIGIVAHVDAGKTTLTEAILYDSGIKRQMGRVDNGDTVTDSDSIEKKRGITVYAGSAEIQQGDLTISLLDTPGHIDFSAETERCLSVLDAAILVISGPEGIQSHTLTLWKLLRLYNIPAFVFITKMDYCHRTEAEILTELNEKLGGGFVDFSSCLDGEKIETLAALSENTIEKWLETSTLTNEDISCLVMSNAVHPCYFGSGLKNEGVKELLNGLGLYLRPSADKEKFGATVYKITRDDKGNRLTLLKVTGGTLKVKDEFSEGDITEKVSEIRIYTGLKWAPVQEMTQGGICAVTGLGFTRAGMTLGENTASFSPVLGPVMRFSVHPVDPADKDRLLKALINLTEEDPFLNASPEENSDCAGVSLMGHIQGEILLSVLEDRFGIKAALSDGNIIYKEKIVSVTEGVGHYEPLRHYAEVHLLLEPGERGSGLVFASKLSEDVLSGSWQRLILTHLKEKKHLGVLTGSELTDTKITLIAGRAHIKHTEGGDFRQATYRAVRHGLMRGQSQLLEPVYSFTASVPGDYTGRLINDIHQMSGSFNPPVINGETAEISGICPVSEMNGYGAELASYTSGLGTLSLAPGGYEPCHNSDFVIEKKNYNPEGDLANTPDSVFCAHGGGFTVKWDKVTEYMHIESPLNKKPSDVQVINRRNIHIDDKELKAILEREFGKEKHELYRPQAPKRPKTPDYDIELEKRDNYVIIDGYNCIFAFEKLKEIASASLENARDKLTDILANYAAYTKYKVIVVFDAYNVKCGAGEKEEDKGIKIVYTKENETGDAYIEKLLHDIGKNDYVRVITSDNLIRLSALRFGIVRVSAAEFEEEILKTEAEISRIIKENDNHN